MSAYVRALHWFRSWVNAIRTSLICDNDILIYIFLISSSRNWLQAFIIRFCSLMTNTFDDTSIWSRRPHDYWGNLKWSIQLWRNNDCSNFLGFLSRRSEMLIIFPSKNQSLQSVKDNSWVFFTKSCSLQELETQRIRNIRSEVHLTSFQSHQMRLKKKHHHYTQLIFIPIVVVRCWIIQYKSCK